MITYDPLWETLKKKEISIYKLINTYHVSRSTIDKLKHNRNITLATLDHLCNILECDITEIIRLEKNLDSSVTTSNEDEQ